MGPAPFPATKSRPPPVSIPSRFRPHLGLAFPRPRGYRLHPMKWKETADALWMPCRACLDLTLSERRLLLGVLLLFCLGLGARWLHQRQARPAPTLPPLENPLP